MASKHKRVQLYKYTKLDGRWKYSKAVFYPNNKIKAHAVMTPTGEQTIKDGYYVLSYARKWESVGNDPVESQRMLLLRRGELATLAHGGSVGSPAMTEPKVGGTVKDAFDAWLQDHQDGGADSETVRIKRGIAREFQESCKERMLANITRSMCLKYINEFLKKQGNGDRTRFNKYLHLRQWLKFHKLELLTTADAPDYEDPEPVAIEDEELEIFWQFCPPGKRLLFTLLLCCGLRKGEIQTLRWVDLVGGREPHIRIQPRPEYNWFPKKHHCRDVPIADDELWAQLMHRKMLSKSPLVFHTASGKPLTHHWEDTQRIFRNAKLDMAKAHPHCWRATYCTTLLRQKVDIPEIMKLMGHKDVTSTMRYLAVLNRQKRHEVMAKVRFKTAVA
jgi:integrase